MATEFDSIQSLLQQIHKTGKDAPPPAQDDQERAAEQEERKRREALERFRKEVLESRTVLKRVRKFRREGVYAVRPWQWAAMVTGGVVLWASLALVIMTFSNKRQMRLAIGRGVTAIYARNVPQAMFYYLQAIRYGADTAAVLNQYGSAMADLDATDSALEFFDRALAEARNPTDSTTAAIRSAKLLLEEKRVEAASEKLEAILRIDPKHRDALILKGKIATLESRYDEAVQYFYGALERNPLSLTPRYYLREVYLRMNKVEDAKDQEDNLLHSRPSGDEDITTLIGYADMLTREGRLQEAEDAYLTVLTTQRKVQPTIMISLGYLAIEMQDLVKARTYADSAVTLVPAFPDGYVLRGELAYERGDGAAAMEDFQKALKLSPRHAKASYDMGCLALYDLGMPDLAHRWFENAASNGFNGPFLWYNIGVSRYLTKRPESALEAFERMPDRIASTTDARWTVANTLLLCRQTDTAIRMYQDLIRGQERNSALDNNLGIALEMRGDTMSAMQLYWNAIAKSGEPAAADTVATANVRRLLASRPVADPWDGMHTEIPLKVRGVVLPRRTRNNL